jgi:hypothetical protein
MSSNEISIRAASLRRLARKGSPLPMENVGGG